MTDLKTLPKRYPLWRTWWNRRGGWTVPIQLTNAPMLRLALIAIWQPRRQHYQIAALAWIVQPNHPLCCQKDGQTNALGGGPMLDLSFLLETTTAPAREKTQALDMSRRQIEQMLLDNADMLERCVNEQIERLSTMSGTVGLSRQLVRGSTHHAQTNDASFD